MGAFYREYSYDGTLISETFADALTADWNVRYPKPEENTWLKRADAMIHEGGLDWTREQLGQAPYVEPPPPAYVTQDVVTPYSAVALKAMAMAQPEATISPSLVTTPEAPRMSWISAEAKRIKKRGIVGNLAQAAGVIPGIGSVGRGIIKNLALRPVTPDCPPDWVMDAQGNCKEPGVQGVINRTLPYGESGYLQGRQDDSGVGSGQAVAGVMGIPAMVPMQVGTRSSGTDMQIFGPILRCMAGMVLGKDSLCYMKGSIPPSWRKWKPGPRPPISGGDAVHIRKAEAAKQRVKKLAQKAGYAVHRKGAGRGNR